MTTWNSDLVVLVADASMESAIRGLLERNQSLLIRPVKADVHTHIERDPGCLLRSHDFLRPLAPRYAHALVLFDRKGCGQETKSRESLEEAVEALLAGAGWGDRAAAVVIDPELEVWVWSDSPHVEDVLGWRDQTPPLRAWLAGQGLLQEGHPKPAPPKEALQRALRLVRKPPSSRIYRDLARRVAVDRCTDPAFLKLRRLLTSWFPPFSSA